MTLPLCLPGRVEGDWVVRRIRRPRITNLFGLLAKPVRVARKTDPSTRTPPFVERLWMPAFAVCLRTVSRRTSDYVWTSVDGWSGQFSLFDGVDELTPGEPDEERFPPGIDESQAAEFARNGLLRYILGQRGQIDKPVIEAVEEVRPYYFPVWVCYSYRHGKYLDVKVLDGCTGKPGGAKMRIAVIDALVAAKKNRDGQPASRTC